MDVVPVPSAGNVLTIREYQQRWLAVFSFISGKPVPAPLTQADVLARARTPARPCLPADARRACPVQRSRSRCSARAGSPPRTANSPTPPRAGLCSETAPGIVFGVKLQPVLAVHDGVVTAVVDTPGAADLGDGHRRDRSQLHAVGVQRRQPRHERRRGAGPPPTQRRSPRSAARSRPARSSGSWATATRSRSTCAPTCRPIATVQLDPDAVAPHIRLTISELDGTPARCVRPGDRRARSARPARWRSVPGSCRRTAPGQRRSSRSRRPTTTARSTRSGTSPSTGQVTAAGWAAMIYPNEGCTFAPPDPHGPGAAGFAGVTLDWIAPVDLPTTIWVQLAVRDEPAPHRSRPPGCRSLATDHPLGRSVIATGQPTRRAVSTRLIS